MRRKNQRIMQWSGAIIAGAMAWSLTGCVDRQAEAKNELAARSYEFTVDDYMRAARDGDVTALRYFLAGKIKVDVTDAESSTALYWAAHWGQEEAVDFLVKNGAKVNVLGPGWDTPLVAAARRGSLETVSRLIKHGAEPQFRTRRHWTALTAAAHKGHAAIVAYLAPLSPESREEALQLASLNGSTSVIDVLLQHGAQVDSRSKDERTPLMLAAAHGQLEAVKVLISAGANVQLVDRKNRRALDHAKLADCQETIKYIAQRTPEPQLSVGNPSLVAAVTPSSPLVAIAEDEPSTMKVSLEPVVEDLSAPVEENTKKTAYTSSTKKSAKTVERSKKERR